MVFCHVRRGCSLLVARTCSQLRRRCVVPAIPASTRSFTSASSRGLGLEVLEVDSCVLRWAEQTPTSVTLRDLCEIGLDSGAVASTASSFTESFGSVWRRGSWS